MNWKLVQYNNEDHEIKLSTQCKEIKDKTRIQHNKRKERLAAAVISNTK